MCTKLGGDLMRRRLMRIMKEEESELIKYGYFNIENPKYPGDENWQISVEDFLVEIDTGLPSVPDKIICTYIDDMQTATKGVSIFISTRNIKNAYADESAAINVSVDDISFDNPSAKYVRYDKETQKLYLSVRQWAMLKCGKWMWIAIYRE